MDFELSERSAQWRGRLQAFFEHEVLPRHRDWLEHVALRREAPPVMGELQAKVPGDCGISALPELAPDEPGTRLSNLEYAPLARSRAGCSGRPRYSIARRRTCPT
jgi:acyl-CoA dehydrogenase